MSTFKEKIESNPIIWLLGTLLAGFLSGIACYEAVLKMANRETISIERLKTLESQVAQNFSPTISDIKPLPPHIDKREIDKLFNRVKSAFNSQDSDVVYDLLGPMARFSIRKEDAEHQLSGYFETLGKIESGF